MILILAILAVTRATPLGLRSPPVVSLDQLQSPGPSCDDPNGCRSLGDIIRSCILTILLCTYVSMHPNIPSPDERWPKLALRRVGLMLLALFVPEAVIAWALRQRQAAVELAKEHKGEGWTITHGFFAIMGGFMKYEGNRPIRVLYPGQLGSYSLTGNGDFPKISKAEIEDKSKGDAISKAVVILQTSWFVMQCIARAVQGLPITELELVTVAFAVLNIAIYLLWREKPQNVQRGVRVYKKRSTEEAVDDGDVETTRKQRGAAPDHCWIRKEKSGAGRYWAKAPWLIRVLLWPLFKPLHILVYGDEVDDDPFRTRVNTFYPAKWVRLPQTLSISLLAAITVTFGAIHCVGWSFDFPSSIERTLWRAASLSISGVPILTFPIIRLGMAMDQYIMRRQPRPRGISLGLILLFFLYMLSRLALLVLLFLCLRSLPSAAFHVVHWTSFIPHV
ncbi:hypothetical protein BC827DRAFT_1341506 [Russula dissimulans]|nr:hypothetical protein BC827DRAFT_1341506 [Russula dissimulans]